MDLSSTQFQLFATSLLGYVLAGQVKGYLQANKERIAPVVGMLTLLINVAWDVTQGQFGAGTFATGGLAALAPAGFHENTKGLLTAFFKPK